LFNIHLSFFTKTDLSYFVTMDRPKVGGETAFHLRKPNNWTISLSHLLVIVAVLTVMKHYYDINRSCIWKFSEFWLALEVEWTVIIVYTISSLNISSIYIIRSRPVWFKHWLSFWLLWWDPGHNVKVGKSMKSPVLPFLCILKQRNALHSSSIIIACFGE